MRLVACDGSVLVCPCSPLFGEIVQQHLSQGLAIIAHNDCVAIQELGELVLQFVAVHIFELCQQGRSPVGAIHFVAVVEESMWKRCSRSRKGAVDVCQIMGYGSRVEVVDDVAFASRRSTLHHLSGAALVECDDAFLLGGSCHRISLDDFQFGEFALFLGQGEVDVHEFLLDIYNGVDENSLAGSLAQWNPRSAERPSCSGSHIGLNAQFLVFLFHESEHFHPSWREVRYVVLVVSLYAIEWSYLHCAYASLGILVEIPSQVLLVDGRSHPPPSYTRFGFLCGGRQELSLCADCCEQCAGEACCNKFFALLSDHIDYNSL